MQVILIQQDLPIYREAFLRRVFEICEGRFSLKVIYFGDCDFEDKYSQVNKFSLNDFMSEINKMTKSDLVIMPNSITTLKFVALTIYLRVKAIPFAHYGHLSSGRTKFRFLMYVRLFYNMLCNYLIFYTDTEKSKFKSTFFSTLKKGSCFSLQNGIDVKPIESCRVPYDACARRNLLFIGRLTRKSNILLLLKAVESMKGEFDLLHIIGDGELRTVVESTVDESGLSNTVVLHGNLRAENEIASIVNTCAIFVYPGDVGLSLNHSMAYGLPAVLHNDTLSHMPEVVSFENMMTGKSFVKGDYKSLRYVLKDILPNSDLLNKMSRTSIEKTKIYNTDVMADRFLDVLEFHAKKK